MQSQNIDINPKTNSIGEFDQGLGSFTSKTHTALEPSVFMPKSKKDKNIIPEEIKREIQVKNRIRREWKRNRVPNTKRNLNADVCNADAMFYGIIIYFLKYVLKPTIQYVHKV